MSVRNHGLECDGCRRSLGLVECFVTLGLDPAAYPSHYCDACWQTGWYTGIEPKGEWPIDPTPPPGGWHPVSMEDPWPDEVGHGAGDPVNHPPHYRWLPNGIEVIDITETLNFNLGNSIKYILRADHKGKPEEDLRKAAWYIERELERRARDNDNSPAVE